jgi:hypothetical protein
VSEGPWCRWSSWGIINKDKIMVSYKELKGREENNKQRVNNGKL